MDPAAGPRQRWRDRARCIRSTHFVMEQKMMRGIRHRAEQTRRDQTAVYIRKYAEGSTRFTLTARWYRQMRENGWMLRGHFRLLTTRSSAPMYRPTIRRSWSRRRTVTRTWMR